MFTSMNIFSETLQHSHSITITKKDFLNYSILFLTYILFLVIVYTFK